MVILILQYLLKMIFIRTNQSEDLFISDYKILSY